MNTNDHDDAQQRIAALSDRIHEIQGELMGARAEIERLRVAAQRPATCDEENAKVAWSLAMQLLKQAQKENEECAYWFVSALSKLASTHPRRPVVEVLALAKCAMPKAARQYADYVADKC
ncbi:MAG: hypothetical protein NDI84_02800 [Steroidobacteraceae bacterium]|nr:hypothetical protein [Steroidobacteraceae bacterium]